MVTPNGTTAPLDIATQDAQDGSMPQRNAAIFTIQARVKESTYRQAEKAAEREGLSVASWARRMISLEIDRLVREGIIPPDSPSN